MRTFLHDYIELEEARTVPLNGKRKRPHINRFFSLETNERSNLPE